MSDVFTAEALFDLSSTRFADIFDNTTYAWEALAKIKDYITTRLETDLRPNVADLDVHPTVAFGSDNIFVDEGTVIEPSVYIEGPALIGKNCVIKHGAFIRANTILGDNVAVGHATETKNTLMLNGAHAPHFSYLGDSILGRNVNLGAGTKLSNLPINSIKDDQTGKRPTVQFKWEDELYDTGLAKIGAVLGDDSQLGCNCVANPGTIIGPRTLVYALASLRKGYYPSDSIVKLRQQVEVVERR